MLQRVGVEKIREVVGDASRLSDCRLAVWWDRGFAGMPPLDRETVDVLQRLSWPAEFIADTAPSSCCEFEERAGPCRIETAHDIAFMIQEHAEWIIAKRGDRAVVPYLEVFARTNPGAVLDSELGSARSLETLIRQLERNAP